jgi:repressor LexA
MVEAGVLQGDLIVVHRQNTAKEGQMVVAQLDNQPEPELTVRYYGRNGKEHFLKRYDSDPSPKEFTPGQMTIVGIVVGLVRPAIRALPS